jgi:hypothetical protein
MYSSIVITNGEIIIPYPFLCEYFLILHVSGKLFLSHDVQYYFQYLKTKERDLTEQKRGKTKQQEDSI